MTRNEHVQSTVLQL